jgi:hypothetical protein
MIAIGPLLPQIGILFDFRLIQAIHNRILPLLDIDSLDQLLIMESNLARGHVAAFLEVAPWGVDDGDVVLFVAFDAVGFGELGTVGEQGFGEIVPGFVLAHAQVDVGGREVVGVEPHVFGPAVRYEVLVSTRVSLCPLPSSSLLWRCN